MVKRKSTTDLPRLKKDDRVRAKYKENGKYYDARIVEWQEKDEGYLVEWLDGIGENRYEYGVPEEAIISRCQQVYGARTHTVLTQPPELLNSHCMSPQCRAFRVRFAMP